MAERLDKLPLSRSRAPKYPIAEWMDGSVWRATNPRDYACSTRSLVRRLRAHARNRGCSLFIREQSASGLTFQFAVGAGGKLRVKVLPIHAGSSTESGTAATKWTEV